MNLGLLRSRGLGAAFLAVALAALGWAAVRDLDALGALLRSLRPAPTALALLAHLGFVLGLGALWRGLLARMGGPRLAFAAATKVQVVAWYARYLPGKLGLVAGKVLLVPGSRGAAVWAAGYEQLLFLVAGAVLVAACAALAAAGALAALVPARGALLVAVLVIALLALGPWLATRGDRLVARLVEGETAPHPHPAAAELALWLAGFLAAHLVVGLGFVALLHALGHGAAFGTIEAIGILTAAHLGGILAVFAPAGLGVREALLAGLLAPTLGMDAALATALVTRGWATLGDLLLAPLLLVDDPR
jgi:hypothetical protein